MHLKYFSTTLLTLVTLLLSPFALAHSGAGHFNGLADGFIHPVTGLDHVLIAVAAGFWAGRSGDHGVRDVVFFMSMLLGGMLLGAVCLAFPLLELSTILVVMLVVVFIALSIAAPQYFGYLFFGGFALYHGILHILEMPALVTAASYLTGLFFSTALLLMLGLILRQVVATLKPHPVTPGMGRRKI